MVLDLDSIRHLIEAAVTGGSLLAGTMAFLSGLWASEALDEGRPPAVVAQRINEAIGEAFVWGTWVALIGMAGVLWS